ncbi:MAG: COX15/CtaA family protein [Dehalococcoidia bacterium]|nr:COX15/CtaA family protein [Dehalococcoidia bacterium]MDW8009921.1 COX15/CtaA family protein [Chloroflexota bacterium]
MKGAVPSRPRAVRSAPLGLPAGLGNIFRLRLWAPLALAATYALLVLGAAVRTEGASLACPDWPLCHGQLLPPLERLVLLEYSHRLLAAVTGLLVLGAAVAGWRERRERPWAARAAWLALPLVLVQAMIGREAVEQEMPLPLRAAHLGMALMTLGTLGAAAVLVLRPAGGARGGRLLLPAAAAAALVLALSLVGSYVSHLPGAALAYSDWPLFEGKVVPGATTGAQVHYAHRLLALTAGAALLWLWLRGRTLGGFPRWASAAALGLYLAQVLVGAANIWLELPTPVRMAHLALAAAIWGLALALAVWAADRRPLEEG